MGDIPVDPEVRQAIMRRQLMMQATPAAPPEWRSPRSPATWKKA